MPHQYYDSPVAAQWGRYQTQEPISENFIWDEWTVDVTRYVARWVKCEKSKADKYSRQTKLVLMPKGEHPFEEIAMHLVGK